MGAPDAGPSTRWRTLARAAATLPFIAAIRLYQVTLSPLMGGQCRFEPTCSRYALAAYRTFGPLKGSWLTLRRLLRCHPFGGWGYDPVPAPRRDAAGGETD